MFPACLQPRCPARLAKTRPWQLTTALAACLLWLSTASTSIVAAESTIRFVDPPCRMQPRHVNETGTSGLVTLSSWHPGHTLPTESAGQLLVRSAERWMAERVAMVQQNRVETIPTPSDAEDMPHCLRPDSLSMVVADITLPEGALPFDVARHCAATTPAVGDKRLDVGWAMTNFNWSATGMLHRPLYFEEINAERYGYTMSYCLQPVISGARFFLSIPALPYKMTVERPHDRIYTLGHYRPGSATVPRRWHRIPLQVTAATVQVGVIAGLILLVP